MTNRRAACRTPLALLAAIALLPISAIAQRRRPQLQFIDISDLHDGITRPSLRSAPNVSATVVKAALVAQLRSLPLLRLPADDGVGVTHRVGPMNFVAVTGDIANREENEVRPAISSWAEFTTQFLTGLAQRDASGARTPVFAIPGNHDVSNAIGCAKPLEATTDAASMVGMYNRYVAPGSPRTSSTHNYAAADSIGQCNRANSDSAGVRNPKVFRGR